jgi:hypothetical protein
MINGRLQTKIIFPCAEEPAANTPTLFNEVKRAFRHTGKWRRRAVNVGRPDRVNRLVVSGGGGGRGFVLHFNCRMQSLLRPHEPSSRRPTAALRYCSGARTVSAAARRNTPAVRKFLWTFYFAFCGSQGVKEPKCYGIRFRHIRGCECSHPQLDRLEMWVLRSSCECVRFEVFMAVKMCCSSGL